MIIDRALTPEEAQRMSERARAGGYLLIWAVTTGTEDFGCCYTARPYLVGRSNQNRAYRSLSCHLVAASLDALRELLPPGLTWIGPGDDEAVIVEVWL